MVVHNYFVLKVVVKKILQIFFQHLSFGLAKDNSQYIVLGMKIKKKSKNLFVYILKLID